MPAVSIVLRVHNNSLCVLAGWWVVEGCKGTAPENVKFDKVVLRSSPVHDIAVILWYLFLFISFPHLRLIVSKI